jgi:stage V sporulation protein B
MYGQLTGKYVLLTTLPVSLSTALAVAAVPSIAGSRIVADEAAVKYKINTAIRLSMIVSIPAAVGLGVLGDPILSLLFPKYPEGGILLKYGIATIIFLAFVQILTGILQGIGKIYVPVIGALFGALIKIPLNYFLIANPAINIAGAVISTFACYAVAAGVAIYFLRRFTGIVPDAMGAFVKPIFSAAAMGLACYSFYHAAFAASGKNGFSVLVAIVLGIAVYAAFLVLVKGFKKDDLESLPLNKRIIKLLGM